MTSYSQQNKKAWEYNAYDFWCSQCTPQESARQALEDPVGQLKRFAAYFDSYKGLKVANICGSCGKKAIPLAVLGADVTVFDISSENKRYATEVANLANVRLNYEVCDVMEINTDSYAAAFDVVFMEGGVLHYFHELERFMRLMYLLLKDGGRLICSDFHPFTKIIDSLGLQQKTMDYFSTDIFEGEMAHARFYPEEVRRQMPLCSYRRYTVSEIINAVIKSGFSLSRFDEIPSWENKRLPGEFVLAARK